MPPCTAILRSSGQWNDATEPHPGGPQGVEEQPGGEDEEQETLHCKHSRAQVVRNKDISDADVEEYFSSYGEVVGVSQERERDGGKKKGSQYVKFSDEDPVDQAVLVGVQNVQTAVLKVERSLSWWHQEEVRIKQEQQKTTGTQRQET